jgi:DNA-binding transcriptional regulator YiaG
MESKIVKHFIYEGLGFPIELQQVEMRKINNKWHPKIDVKRVADAAMVALVSQKERLTGNQIKFIRSYFSMSLRDFANKVVNESHSAVSKWEKCGNNATNMDINIEKILRLYIYDKVCVKANVQKTKFYQTYQQISHLSFTNS